MDLDLQNATPSTRKEQSPKGTMDNDAEIAGPSTCTKLSQQANISENSSLKTKLRIKNKQLKAQIKTLRESIRRLRKEKEHKNRRKAANAEDADQFETA